MKNKKVKRIIRVFIIFILFISTTSVNAGFWEQASNWYSGGSTGTYLDSSVITEIADMVEVVGTAVIAIATIVLGVKYVLGSVTEKADVKDSMITLLFACVFFFGWANIRDILIKGVTYNADGALTSIN